jgi:hypothetical protein
MGWPPAAEASYQLPESYFDAAFDAREVARRHISEEWQYRTDPRNLTPPVPAVRRRAADLVRRAGAVVGDAHDDLVAGPKLVIN